MSNKKTLEQFINQANKVHNFKYSYKDSVYLGNKEKIEIKCPIHGKFQQICTNHLANHGCKKCAILIIANKRRFCLEEILIKFKEIHGDKYNYEKFQYENGNIKSIVTCYHHGDFKIDGASHLQGHGCVKCGINETTLKRLKPIEKFKEQAIIIHGNKYDYSLVEYKGAKKKVKIICNNCKNTFSQIPDAHINLKYGCRNCGNENNYHKETWIKRAKDRQGTFYIIKCFNDNEEFYKFGITFNSIQKRYIHKSFMPYNYEVIREVQSKDLSYIWDLEKRFKKFKKKNHYTPFLHFAGDKQECFKN